MTSPYSGGALIMATPFLFVLLLAQAEPVDQQPPHITELNASNSLQTPTDETLLPCHITWKDWLDCATQVSGGIDVASLASQYTPYRNGLAEANRRSSDRLRALDVDEVRRDILQGTLDPSDRRPSQIDVVLRRLEAVELRLRSDLLTSLAELIGDEAAGAVIRMWRRRVVIDQQPSNTIDWSRFPDLDCLVATHGSPWHTIATNSKMQEDAAAIWNVWDLEADTITTEILMGWATLLRNGWKAAATASRQPTGMVGRAELRLWKHMIATTMSLADVARQHGEPELAGALIADFRSRSCPHAWGQQSIDRHVSALAQGTFPSDIAAQLHVVASDWRSVSQGLRNRAAALSWWDREVMLQEREPTTPPDRWIDINQAFIDAMLATADTLQGIIDLDVLEPRDGDLLNPHITGPARPPMSPWLAEVAPLPTESMQQRGVNSYKQLYEELTQRTMADDPQTP